MTRQLSLYEDYRVKSVVRVVQTPHSSKLCKHKKDFFVPKWVVLERDHEYSGHLLIVTCCQTEEQFKAIHSFICNVQRHFDSGLYDIDQIEEASRLLSDIYKLEVDTNFEKEGLK